MITLDMLSFAKIMKTIKSNSLSISFSVDKRAMSKLNINIIESKNRRRSITLNKLKKNVVEYEIPQEKWTAQARFPTEDIHKIIKDMGSYAEKLCITFINNKKDKNTMQIRCTSEIVHEDLHTIVGESLDSDGEDDDDILITGVFDIKVISLFLKYGNISQNVILYVKKDKPFMFQYDVGDFGIARFLMAQRPSKDSNIQVDSDDDDDEDDDDAEEL